MGRVVTNDVSAIIPEIWSSSITKNLYKSLVAMEIANTELSDTLKFGDTIHKPYFGNLSAQTYTRGTPISATNLDWAFDNLVVSSYKHCTFYIDDVEALQANVSQIAPLASEAAYQLSNAIDAHVFRNITADGFVNFQADAGTLQGGTAHRPISAGSAAIITIFANARKLLRQNNVEEMGDWCAVVTPQIAYYIESKSTSVGYNTADATLKNGYTGDFMGFKVYISNNLPSGKCSAIASTISGGAVSATTCKAIYFGRKGMIDLVMQKSPALEIRKCEDKLGANFITWTVYGSTVFTRNRSRGLNVAVQSSYY
jgi:hypothetical protein